VTWDTVRADAVGPRAGEAASPTPRLDALARAGVTFAQARSPVPITLPAHASLLTGLWPASHGVRENGLFEVAPQLPLLQQELGAAGYATGAFVSASVLDRRYGLARGFDHYDDAVAPRPRERAVPTRSAGETVDAALAWLDAVPAEQPLFLWLHLYDPHRPWHAPPSFGERFPDDYRAEIAYADAETGRLLDALETRGRLARSLVVLTSDHGEGLGDHGEQTHAYFAYDSTLRVPLVLWLGPEIATEIGVARGARVEGPASLVDVMPTLLELAGVTAPETEGRSLVASLAGAPVPPRLQPVESAAPAYGYGTAPVFGVITPEDESWFRLPRPERYDLARDPGQQENLYRPGDAARAETLFAGVEWDWPPESAAAPVDAATRSQLEALGYAVGTSEPGSPDVDPKDRVELANFLTVNRHGLAPDAALARARALEERHGLLPALARFEIDMLDAMGRSRDSLELLERAVEANPDHRELRELRQQRVEQWTRRTALAGAIRRTLKRSPDHPSAHRDLALTLHQLQQLEEAEPFYRVALRREPDSLELRANLANLLLTRGEPDAALEALDAAPADQRDDPQLHCQRGRILAFHLERPDEARAPLGRCRDAGVALSEIERALLEAPSR